MGLLKDHEPLVRGGRLDNLLDSPWARDEYERIRELNDDVADIMRNTGLTDEGRLNRIKEYLFNNSDEFSADPAIARAWERLRTGNGISDDLLLLKHETAEMWLRNNKGLDYRDAHDAANEKFNWGITVSD